MRVCVRTYMIYLYDVRTYTERQKKLYNKFKSLEKQEELNALRKIYRKDQYVFVIHIKHDNQPTSVNNVRIRKNNVECKYQSSQCRISHFQ